MKKIAGWTVIALLGGVLLAAGSQAPAKDAPLTPDQRMDKLFDFWNRLDQPGFAALVVKDGRILYQKTYGLACQEHGVPIAANTVFNIGDASQAFVGQAVALLEKQGRLSLDDDVRKVLPELPDFGTLIRLRHLLFHCSGLRDWLPVIRLTGREAEEFDFTRLLKILQSQKKLIFAPGQRCQYSNTNYDLLAETIKRITGQSFSDWAFENIFKPLKMTRTQFRDNYRSIIDNQAFTYNFTRQEYLKGIDTLSLTGSHSLFISIGDLAKWLTAAETGGAGGLDVTDKIFTPARLNNGSAGGYGYGWAIQKDAGRRQAGVTGIWAGSGAVLIYYPDQKFGFAVLANWDYTSVGGFVPDIIDIYLPAPAPAAPPKIPSSAAAPQTKKVSLSPQILDSYCGDFRLGPGQIMTFLRTNDQFFLQIPGQKFALTTLTETEFLFDLAGARIVFQKDKAGKVSQMTWVQGGEETIAPRVIMVKPTAEELKAFAGLFFNEELSVRYRIEARGEALVIIDAKGVEARLAPDEKDHFTSRAASLPMIIFQRDAQGRVAGFRIDSDPVGDLLFRKD